MSKIEILAPVGSEEMLRAAVFSGADAVYLGFSGFNARTGAGNFDADSLKEAVSCKTDFPPSSAAGRRRSSMS